MKLSVDTYKSLTSLVILYQSAAVEILLKYFPTAIYTYLQQALQSLDTSYTRSEEEMEVARRTVQLYEGEQLA